MYQPSFEQFRKSLESGKTVRVHGQFLGDSLTPIAAFLKVGTSPFSCLLESVTGGENVGRYSFVAADPMAVFVAFGRDVRIEQEGRLLKKKSDDPLRELWDLIQQYSPVAKDALPRLAGGAVGYVGYDTVRFIERLPDMPPDDLGLPDLYFCIYDTMLIFDNVDKSLRIVTNVFPRGQDAEEAYTQAIHRIDRVAETLATPTLTSITPVSVAGETAAETRSTFDRSAFLSAVSQCKEFIRAGDIFQVVLSQRFHTQTKARPFDVYRALRTVNPSPYMFYQSFGNLKLIGASPEVMVRVEDGVVTVRPIAGTRRRGRTPEEDRKMADELLHDPKEIAEHVMLLDLGRNDVGRIADFNTVKVTETMELERYSHVMHMTSNVQGKLSMGRTALDALKACFPAGTVSGAPKIRAMEIIDECEPTKRGPYAGAVGYFDFAGNMDTCIAIRTIILKGEDAYVQAGAGIVADSVPELEYKETQNKARALLKAIEVAEQYLG